MGGTTELPEDARKLLEGFAESLSGDLEALVGTPVRVALEGALVVDAAAAAADAREAVHAVLEPKGGGDPLHALLPAADAVTLGGLLLGQDADAIREARKSEPEQEVLDAFGEVLNMGTALLGRVLAEGVGGSELERGAVRPLGPEPGEFLPSDRHLRIRFELRPEGLDAGRLDLFVPLGLAATWWELAEGPAGKEAETADAPGGAGEPESGEAGPLVVFEADPDERDRLEDLSEGLGCEVVAYEYADWGEDLVEELAEARAVVVSFDLRGRSGLELLETLAARRELARVALLLADEAPTRALLRAAFRAGAHGFVPKPWRGEELAAAVTRARAVLRACLGEETAAGAGAPEGGDSAGAAGGSAGQRDEGAAAPSSEAAPSGGSEAPPAEGAAPPAPNPAGDGAAGGEDGAGGAAAGSGEAAAASG